jgi:NitT/TauT family transport system substrate-binding protein
MPKLRILFTCLGLLLVGHPLLLQSAHAQNKTNLRITIPVQGLVYYPVLAARDLGYFSDEGISMEVVVTQGDGPDVDALIAGSVQFAATTPNRLMTAYEKGKPLLGILTVANRIGVNCFMNKERADSLGITEKTPLLEKFGKLRGLTLGGSRPGAFTSLLAADYLKRAGMTPQQDAKIIGVGGGPAMLAALENKQIDFGCVASPTPELAVARGKSIMFVNNTQGWDPQFEEFLFAVLYVRPDYAKEKPDTVRAVVRALQRAMKYIVDTPFKDQQAMLARDFGELDPAILQESLINTQAAIVPSGRVSERSVMAAEKFLVGVGSIDKEIPWQAVIDNSFIDSK